MLWGFKNLNRLLLLVNYFYFVIFKASRMPSSIFFSTAYPAVEWKKSFSSG